MATTRGRTKKETKSVICPNDCEKKHLPPGLSGPAAPRSRSRCLNILLSASGRVSKSTNQQPWAKCRTLGIGDQKRGRT